MKYKSKLVHLDLVDLDLMLEFSEELKKTEYLVNNKARASKETSCLFLQK